jgi:ABC-type phosphate transport system substrate-binding protein
MVNERRIRIARLIAGHVIGFALASMPPVAATAAEVKVNGATTVAFGLMKPQQRAIEQSSNVQLAILPSSTTHGLMDLAKGQADIAMLAEPLESAAEAVNRINPGMIVLSEYVGRHVGDAFVQFIVHPSNPLRKLSREQLAGLYSGRIRNWVEIGGSDQPVLVVGEPSSSPYRMIQDALGISYTSDLRVVQNTNQTAIVVAQAPGALSNISTAHDMPERSRFKVMDSEVKLPLHLYVAYRKNATPAVTSVINATIAAAKL